jgi:hypothetical protein
MSDFWDTCDGGEGVTLFHASEIKRALELGLFHKRPPWGSTLGPNHFLNMSRVPGPQGDVVVGLLGGGVSGRKLGNCGRAPKGDCGTWISPSSCPSTSWFTGAQADLAIGAKQ